MVAILFKCPQTGVRVQGWVSDEPIKPGQARAYAFASCTMCNLLHLIDRITGKSIHEQED